MTISTEKRERGGGRWGTARRDEGQGSEIPMVKFQGNAVKEEISKRIESESQEVCCGCALVCLGWCLSFFFTLLSRCVNTAIDCAAHPEETVEKSCERVWSTPLILPYQCKRSNNSIRAIPRAKCCYLLRLWFPPFTLMYMIFLFFSRGENNHMLKPVISLACIPERPIQTSIVRTLMFL